MKKILSLLSTLFLILTACSQPMEEMSAFKPKSLSRSESQSMVFTDIPSQDGSVNSWLSVDSTSALIKVGTEGSGWMKKTFKGFVTFDTSALPDNAEILTIDLWGAMVQSTTCANPSTIESKVLAEFSGPFGFGGNAYFPGFDLAGMDYYAAAVDSGFLAPVMFFPTDFPWLVAANSENGGHNAHLLSKINKSGKTQIRLSLSGASEECFIALTASEYEDSESPLRLVVTYR